MTKEEKEVLVNIYNTLSTMIPAPSEEYSTKHVYCLQNIRLLLQKDQNKEEE